MFIPINTLPVGREEGKGGGGGRFQVCSAGSYNESQLTYNWHEGLSGLTDHCMLGMKLGHKAVFSLDPFS